MLVLSRRQGESVIVGDDFLVTVLEIKQNRVRLLITSKTDDQVVKLTAPPLGSAASATAVGQGSGDVVVLGKDVSVQVVDIRGHHVRLRFVMPKGMNLHRWEIDEQITQGGGAWREWHPATAEGRARRRDRLKDAIASSLEHKFGEIAKDLIAEIRQSDDIEKLQRLSNSIPAAATITDARRAWSC
jgi:sRNA-binding carbon storage regulator CsrA